MPKLMGLIFDLDGTLLDSAPDLRNALNRMLEQHGRRKISLEEIKTMVGDGMLVMVQRALKATGGAEPNSDMDYFKDFIVHYRNLVPDPAQIYPGAKEALEGYFNAGVKLGICTNKQAAMTNKILGDLGLLKYFEFVAGGDTFTTHKPNPDHMYGVITALDVPRENCVMVGDSKNDVLAAHGAGIPCIVATLGYAPDWESLGADKLIPGFAELPAALAELGFEL